MEEEPFPNARSELPLAQLHPISPCLVTRARNQHLSSAVPCEEGAEPAKPKTRAKLDTAERQEEFGP